MPIEQPEDRRVLTNLPGRDDGSPVTLRLLEAAHTCHEARHLNLYREVHRINDSKEWDTSELVALSVKIGPGKIHRNRYDSPVEWTEEGAANFYTSVARAAPTEAITLLLKSPSNYIAEWIRSTGRFFSYLAVDYDTRVYKIYLFDPDTPVYLDCQDLRQLLPRLYPSSYIDCMEVDLDQPLRYKRSVYFKLTAPSLVAVLEPDYRPNPQIENRILKRINDPVQVVDALRSISAGLQRVSDPVIKLRYSPDVSRGNDDISRLSAADYAISINTFDPGCQKYINDCRDEILSIGRALGCQDKVRDWLEAIREFDCCISYICVGSDFVTFYYKSTVLIKKRIRPDKSTRQV